MNQNSKICSRCKESKFSNEFGICKFGKTGLNSWCKICKKEYASEYRNRPENKEIQKQYIKRYQEENKEKIKEQRRIYIKKRYHNEPNFRLNHNMRTTIRRSLNGDKQKKWESLIGYTLKDLKIHLEKQFDENMSWNNYGSYWHIDHKKPKSIFNFISSNDREFKECWSLNNLQPMEGIKNIIKSNKY